MSVLYFANVGNRDVKHAEFNQVIPRLSGKEWLNDYDNKKTKLNFPILRNGLSYALEQLNGKPIDKLFLFYTDQKKETVIERHYQSDTIFFAEIIKRLIAEQMSDRVKSVNLVRIDGAPNDYDEMYRFYGKELETICKHEKADCTFFAPAGGTPACNMTMVLHGSRIFQHKSRVILISETPGSTPKSLNISSEIIRNHNRKALEKMAEHYDYYGISSLLQLSNKPLDRDLMNLALYANYRLCLDYQRALQYLNKIGRTELSDDPLLDELSRTAKQFIREVPALHSGATRQDKDYYLMMKKQQICGICLCALIKFKTAQYTDFVGRIFRIQEGLVRWFFEYYTGYSSNVSRKFRYHDDFSCFCSTNIGREFKAYLDRKNRNNYRMEPNRIILTKFWSWHPDGRRRFTEFQRVCNYLHTPVTGVVNRNKNVIRPGLRVIDNLKEVLVCPVGYSR